jgi:diacylglycerol O-acyltransferase
MRRPPLWWELPLALLVFIVSAHATQWTRGDKPALAHAHALRLFALESRLGLAIEVPANRWLTEHAGAEGLANYVYAAGYILTSLALLTYLYVRVPPLYRWARRSCILLNLVAAAVFTLYPMAPPRLTPGMSIVDTVSGQHIWGSWGSPVADTVNQFAALPSLHFALVLWVAYMLWLGVRSVVLRLLGVANVVLTAIVVITTGNHFVFDLVAATLLSAACLAVTRPGLPEPRLPRRTTAFLRRTAILTEDSTRT